MAECVEIPESYACDVFVMVQENARNAEKASSGTQDYDHSWS